MVGDFCVLFSKVGPGNPSKGRQESSDARQKSESESTVVHASVTVLKMDG